MIKKFLLAVAIVVSTSLGVSAQPCLQSFDIDPAKKVTHFGWLPGDPSLEVTEMSCSAAEELRTEIYVNNLSENADKIFASPDALSTTIKAQRDAAIAKRNELDDMLEGDPSKEALKAVVKVLWYETTKFFVLVGCTAPSPDPWTKGACAVGLVSSAVATSDLISGDLEKDAIQAHIATLDEDIAKYDELYQIRLTETEVSELHPAQKQLQNTFFGLCATIKDQCLQ